MSTATLGMMYHSGSLGTRDCSTGVRLLGPSSNFPTKSACSITVVALTTLAGPVLAKTVNSPAVTLVGVKAPESS